MAPILVVLESKNKVAKVQKFLGDGYIVTASNGHLRDLPKKTIGIDTENGFKPSYVPTQKATISHLRKLAKKCSDVYLACDKDREGESIAWHIAEVLKIPASKRKRMVFTEITKTAIQNALAHIVPLDVNLFQAQETRRIVDRLHGYKISPILWKEIQSSSKEYGLSAGRVQSFTLNRIIKREREIKDYKYPPNKYVLEAKFIDKNELVFKANLVKPQIKSKEDCKLVLQELIGEMFVVKSKKKRETKSKPPKTFITSTLQQEANNKWRMSPKITMSIAQNLYVRGVITYPRVDSHNIAEEKIDEIKQYIEDKYGEKFVNNDDIEDVEVKNSQDAHEAIRPVNIDVETLDDSFSDQERRMYELIYKRTIASFMTECVVSKTKISILNGRATFETTEEEIVFYGWKILYKSEEKPKISIDIEQVVKYKEIIGREKVVSCPKSHYTEASLIKHMDELGVGRPSTYATMISIVLDRKYAEIKDVKGIKIKTNQITLKEEKIEESMKDELIGAEKKKIVPTDIGIVVNEFMEKYFNSLIDIDYTNNLETKLDLIATNKLDSRQVLKELYGSLEQNLNEIQKQDTKFKDNYKRDLGFYPKTKNMVSCYIGKYGPVLCLMKEGGNKYVSIKDERRLKTITLEEAIELLKFPKVIGKVKGKEVKLCKGRYGPYINFNKKNIKFPKELDINKVKLEDVRELL